MRNVIKKLNIWLLCLVIALMCAVPALAEPAEDYAVLKLNYRPGGNVPTGEASVLFRAYRVAEPVAGEDGSAGYALTGEYARAEGARELLDGLNGRQLFSSVNALSTSPDYRSVYTDIGDDDIVPFDYSVVADWVRVFGGYINNRQMNDDADDREGTAEAWTIDGVATFTGLDDGIYLIASNHAYKINGVQYVAAPFIIQIPYVTGTADAQTVNNYITANVKWFTPSAPRDPDPDPTQTPALSDPPSDEPQDEPSDEPPEEPPEEDFEDIPEEGPPLSDMPEIDILPEDVPLANMTDSGITDMMEIVDEGVPLASLPQTGLLWWPVPVMLVLGLLLVIIGWTKKRKTGRKHG